MATVNTTSTPSVDSGADNGVGTATASETGSAAGIAPATVPAAPPGPGGDAIPAPRQPLDNVSTSAHAHDVDPDQISYASLYTVTAASRPGGLARGNLAVLIRYWTRGEGRARIRWGSGGDFNRCVRLLSKYVPVNQVRGFCARLHRIATGSWPGPGRRH